MNTTKTPAILISEELLLRLDFEYFDLGDDSPYEMWEKHNIRIWDYNEEYWLVDMLNQAGIDKKFRTLDELERFFQACGLTCLKEQRLQPVEKLYLVKKGKKYLNGHIYTTGLGYSFKWADNIKEARQMDNNTALSMASHTKGKVINKQMD